MSSVGRMSSSSRSARVESLLDQMTLEEQVSLLAGSNMWHTVPNDRLEIPKMRVSDGPAGVRGSRFDGPESLNVPCGTALAATWNPQLIREVGELLGREMHSKGASVHLAPTVNLHRTPVGGRNFECMSEDPLLTAVIAVEYVKGVQSYGVASCIKHFVGNDTEFERMTIDSQIDERTLREMYLIPFERAVRDADVMSVMTAYNRINGPYAADSSWLLQDVLRNEWGFDGVVISDWFGLHSTVEAAIAGCDLEMPGPTRHRGQKLVDAVRNGDVSDEVIRDRARNVLNVMERTGALDKQPGNEYFRDDYPDFQLIQRAGAEGMVLLKNENDVLPLQPQSVSSIAVIGPNVYDGRIMGGGSAFVKALKFGGPLDALVQRFQDVPIDYAPGCSINKKIPQIEQWLLDNVVVDFFESPEKMDAGAAPDKTDTTDTFHITWFGDPLGRRSASGHDFAARFTMGFTPRESGEWQFGVESVAPVVITLDGDVVLDNADAPVGGSFFGSGKHEKVSTFFVEADRRYELQIELRHRASGMGISGLNLGAMAPIIGDQVAEAVSVAAKNELSLLVVGTNEDWESEGWDRTAIDLPGEQDRLIREVARVSKKTIVVVNAGSPVAMPWLDDVDAVIYAWFPGQHFGDSLLDVLMGIVEPSGRLPVTFPKKLSDTPAAEHHPGRNGAAKYLEGRLVGYRWYDTVGREPLFPFGFGLGYASISIDDAATSGTHTVTATLRNDSDRDGVQVVQVYAHKVDRDGLASDEPDQRLVGFTRVVVPAKSSVNALVRLDIDAYRTWDLNSNSWMQWSGGIELRVGTSSRHHAHRMTVTLP